MNGLAQGFGLDLSTSQCEHRSVRQTNRATSPLIKIPATLYNARMAGNAPQSPESTDGPKQRQDAFLRLQSVMVYVRNLDRSLAFYQELLGFQIVFDGRKQSGQPGQPWVVVAPPDGTANLTLIVPRTDSEQFKQIGRASHVTFVTEDVLEKFREWSKRGVHFLSNPRLRRFKHALQLKPTLSNDRPSSDDHAPPIWGAVFSRFRDPDGNTFSLVSFDEVTHAVEVQRRFVAERQEAERRAAQELEIAQQVQARLFPQTLPPMRTLDYAGICHQARQVGGDYCDFLDLGGERLGLIVGDISGKGIAAALLMANLQANLRSQSAVALDQPQRFLCSVNQLFCQNTSGGSFATLSSIPATLWRFTPMASPKPLVHIARSSEKSVWWRPCAATVRFRPAIFLPPSWRKSAVSVPTSRMTTSL